MDDQTILNKYKELPLFRDQPTDKEIDQMCRLSSDEELTVLVALGGQCFNLFTVSPRHGFYVIERIEIKNNPKQITSGV